MSTTNQHEFHPDAESLNAFAEQALSARERGDVLEHLAVCGRCRQVVALAREAADAELAATAAPLHPVAQPIPWWRRWRLALAPAAALAVTAAVAFYMHERDSERIAEMAKTAPPAITQNELIPAPPPLQEESKAAPAAGAVPAAKAVPPEKPANPHPRPGAIAAAPPSQPNAPPAQSQTEMARDEAPAMASAPSAGFTPAKPDDSPTPEIYRSMPAVSEFKEEQKLRALQRQQAEASQSPMLGAAATPVAGDRGANHAPGANAPSAAETNNAQLEERSEPSRAAATKNKLQMGGLFAARMKAPTRLPSGLPAVSTANADHRMLAVDQAGTLFFSEDSGSTWQQVARQWAGHAVAVRRHAPSTPDGNAAPPTDELKAGSGGAAPSPRPLFEILNDKSQVWLSVDGKIWLPE